MVSGSRRSWRGLRSQPRWKGIIPQANDVRQAKRQPTQDRCGRPRLEALGEAGHHQRAELLAVGQHRLLVRAARHVVRHGLIRHRHRRRRLHRTDGRRRGERPGSEPHDHQDREQTTEKGPGHGRQSLTGRERMEGRRAITSLRPAASITVARFEAWLCGHLVTGSSAAKSCQIGNPDRHAIALSRPNGNI